MTVYVIFGFCTFDVHDVDDQRLIQEAAEIVNDNYTRWTAIDESKANSEAGRKALHEIKVRAYHKEEASVGLL